VASRCCPVFSHDLGKLPCYARPNSILECGMDNSEQTISAGDAQPEYDYGKPLLVEWMDSEWFQVWLRLARHEEAQPA